MTKEEVEVAKQRTRESWAKYQEASKMSARRFQHFSTPEALAEHLRQVEEAKREGAPF